MRPEVEEAIGAHLHEGARVLDVGGARDLCRYATHVIDILPQEVARAVWAGRLNERSIPAENWIVQDICARQSFPFPDKYFDYAVCSHTLEDIRDPIGVVAEMSRVAKAGCIETPSPFLELTRGVDRGGRRWVGYSHHRWIVCQDDGKLVFLAKPHFLAVSRRFHFPRRYQTRWLRDSRAYTQLFWEGDLQACERVVTVRQDLEDEIERMIRSVRGDTLPIRWGRFSRRAWRAGVHVADVLQIRTVLRPLASRARQWL